MNCPRLSHFVKLRPPNPFSNNGVVESCCHMVNPPTFANYEAMQNSEWLQKTKDTFNEGIFPVECIRCAQVEELGETSVRQHAIEFDKTQTVSDYLVADVVLDNICNSACQFCNSNASTKIGSLSSSNYVLIDNTTHLSGLPLDRMVQIDLTGGEPSNSKNIKNLLKNLPINVNTVRLNTNCSSFMDELIPLVNKGIHLSITVSFDGINDVHNYVRWPIKWPTFHKTLLEYQAFANANPKLVNINLWTTVNTLNVCDLENIIKFAKENMLSQSFSMLAKPLPLNIKFSNKLTLLAKSKFADSDNEVLKNLSKMIASNIDNQLQFDNFVNSQDALRKIRIDDYIKFG